VSKRILKYIKTGAFPVEPAILALVVALNEIDGIETTSSCEGHTDREDPPKWSIWFHCSKNRVGWLGLELIYAAVDAYRVNDLESDAHIETSFYYNIVAFELTGSRPIDRTRLPKCIRRAKTLPRQELEAMTFGGLLNAGAFDDVLEELKSDSTNGDLSHRHRIQNREEEE